MSYTVTIPATIEGVQLNQVVNVVPVGVSLPAISVTATLNSGRTGNIVTIPGTTSFTITGQFYDNWSKTITYEEFKSSGNATVVATKWADVSPNLNFITEYLAATSPASYTATYTVVINGTITMTATQTINNDYTPGALQLKQFVSKGKY